jgi:hypothetical protein
MENSTGSPSERDRRGQQCVAVMRALELLLEERAPRVVLLLRRDEEAQERA